jgi:membrane-associated HD superfamily phosphohydrolase
LPAANNNNKSSRKNLKHSNKIAISGIVVALSVVVMFMTGAIPMATLSLPAIAGFLMVILVIETDFNTALVAYLASSILILLITPDREAAIVYIFFFGHYCIIKSKIELIKIKFFEYLVKIGIFNICIVSAYMLFIFLFGFDKTIESFGEFGKYSLIIYLLAGNVIFIIYDFAITNLITVYIKIIRPRFFRKIE